MTLIELLVALLVAVIIVVPAYTFLRGQQEAYALGVNQLTLTQNYRFAANTLERELRTLGSGLPTSLEQPALVYADSNMVVFNADYTTSTNGARAKRLYTDTAASALESEVLPPSRAITLPGAFTYPSVLYRQGNTPSPAETILFSFKPDSTTARTDDWVLMRQVNDQPAAVVARGILRTPGLPFFRYYKISDGAGGAPRVVQAFPDGTPLEHRFPTHTSAAAGDSAASARADSVRAVRVSFSVTNGIQGPREFKRRLSRLIGLPNAGKEAGQSCGYAPAAPTGVSAAQTPGERTATVSWSPSPDEGSGEKDVLGYSVWRKADGAADYGNAIGSIGAGLSSYAFVDAGVQAGTTYRYAVTAQDCTPMPSLYAESGSVTIVNP